MLMCVIILAWLMVIVVIHNIIFLCFIIFFYTVSKKWTYSFVISIFDILSVVAISSVK